MLHSIPALRSYCRSRYRKGARKSYFSVSAWDGMPRCLDTRFVVRAGRYCSSTARQQQSALHPTQLHLFIPPRERAIDTYPTTWAILISRRIILGRSWNRQKLHSFIIQTYSSVLVFSSVSQWTCYRRLLFTSDKLHFLPALIARSTSSTPRALPTFQNASFRIFPIPISLLIALIRTPAAVWRRHCRHGRQSLSSWEQHIFFQHNVRGRRNLGCHEERLSAPKLSGTKFCYYAI